MVRTRLGRPPGDCCPNPGRGDGSLDHFMIITEASRGFLRPERSPFFSGYGLTECFLPLPEVARGVLTSLPGDSVTLTCPGGEPEDNATVHWVLRKPAVGSHLSRWAGVGRRLLLRSVQLHDSGNYSCYRAGRPAGTVHLLVDGELCLRAPGDSSHKK